MNLDRTAKLIGAVVGLGSIGGGLVSLIIWAGNRASASEVSAMGARVMKTETRLDDQAEFQKWMIEQLSQVSWALHVPVAPPPVRK